MHFIMMILLLCRNFGQNTHAHLNTHKHTHTYTHIHTHTHIHTPVLSLFFSQTHIKLSCDSRFQRAFTAYVCFFKVITLIWANQGNYFENANACSKRTLKTTVTTQLKVSEWESHYCWISLYKGMKLQRR